MPKTTKTKAPARKTTPKAPAPKKTTPKAKKPTRQAIRLNLYQVRVPICTYCAAESEPEAIQIAQRAWLDDGLGAAPSNWNENFNYESPQAIQITNPNDSGLAYYNEDLLGPNLCMHLSEFQPTLLVKLDPNVALKQKVHRLERELRMAKRDLEASTRGEIKVKR